MPVFPPQRRDLLLKILNERKQISVKSLAEELGVSEGTLRTDLKILEDEGSLERTHGGAVPPRSNAHEFRYFSRSDLNREEKSRIAHAAALFVRKGQSVILDASSTALELAKLLVEFDYLTVVTNGLESAMELNRNPRVNRRSISTSINADDIDILITDARADRDFVKRLSRLQVVVAE